MKTIVRHITTRDIERALADYERRYGVPSDDLLTTAFQGDRSEDPDIRRWRMLYRTWRTVGGSARSRVPCRQ